MVYTDLAILIIAILFLVKFSNIVIKNAVKLSDVTGINQATIGFVFIALTTSLPELTIGLISSINGNGLLSIGNLLGANIANLTLVFGLMALFGFNMGKIYSKEIQDAVLSTSFIAMVIVLAGTINLAFGIFCLSIFYLFSRNIMSKGVVLSSTERPHTISSIKYVIYLIISVLAVVGSAYIITNVAISLAGKLGIAESIIGATILSIGTTLPEVFINVNAIRKGNVGLAIGDMVGSIVTNLTFIIGLVAILGNITITYVEATLATVLIGFNIIFYLLSSRLSFNYKQGLFLLSSYALFLFLVLVIL
jgi:cation:H+ antiporter